MGTAERRLEILKYLCKKRHATMPELSEQFGVSLRTIQRDIYEIETTFRVPIDVKCGKYDGGVYVIGNYSFDKDAFGIPISSSLGELFCFAKFKK